MDSATAARITQSPAEAAPSVRVVIPSGQGMEFVAPAVSTYVPIGAKSQEIRPDIAWNDPGAHGVGAIAPGASTKNPAGEGTQGSFPSVELNVPGAQGTAGMVVVVVVGGTGGGTQPITTSPTTAKTTPAITRFLPKRTPTPHPSTASQRRRCPPQRSTCRAIRHCQHQRVSRLLAEAAPLPTRTLTPNWGRPPAPRGTARSPSGLRPAGDPSACPRRQRSTYDRPVGGTYLALVGFAAAVLPPERPGQRQSAVRPFSRRRHLGFRPLDPLARTTRVLLPLRCATGCPQTRGACEWSEELGSP